MPYYPEDYSHNWWAWREHLRWLLERGFKFERCSLEPEENGYRYAHVEAKHIDSGIITLFVFRQPWTKERHVEANTNYCLVPCEDCGVRNG